MHLYFTSYGKINIPTYMIMLCGSTCIGRCLKIYVHVVAFENSWANDGVSACYHHSNKALSPALRPDLAPASASTASSAFLVELRSAQGTGQLTLAERQLTALPPLPRTAKLNRWFPLQLLVNLSENSGGETGKFGQIWSNMEKSPISRSSIPPSPGVWSCWTSPPTT